jgi:predicted nucleic acid-binding protein
MDWLDRFYGKIIGLDTAPLIYFIEEGNYFDLVSLFFETLSEGNLRAVTSTITLLEVLVQPYRCGNKDLAEKYREILLYSDNLLTFPVSNEIADKAAELRAKYKIRTPDAVQVATALHGEASIYLTNDKSLKKIQEIDMITLFDIEESMKM